MCFQNEFPKGLSFTDPPLFLMLLIEKRSGYHLEKKLCFVDYEKAFDRVQRETSFESLKTGTVSDTFLKAIFDINSQYNIIIKLNSQL